MATVLSFSPVGAEMAEEHVYLSLFPQCLWGEGATAANAVEMRPLMADTPRPPLPHLPPCVNEVLSSRYN